MTKALMDAVDIREGIEPSSNGAANRGIKAQERQKNRAHYELLEKAHDLTSRKGILDWMAAVALALTHDLPEMPRQKANTSAYVASVSLKAIQA